METNLIYIVKIERPNMDSIFRVGTYNMLKISKEMMSSNEYLEFLTVDNVRVFVRRSEILLLTISEPRA